MEPLFRNGVLDEYFERARRTALNNVDSITPDYLLRTNTDDLCRYYEERFRLTVPELKTDQIEFEQREEDVDVSQDFNRAIDDRSEPFYVKGTVITYIVPFEGDTSLFRYSPSAYASIFPLANIERGELHFEYKTADHDAGRVQASFDTSMSEIEGVLRLSRERVATFNEALAREVREKIEQRRAKLLKDQGMAASIKYPMRRREGMPQTYVVPMTRKKLVIQMPKPSGEPFQPEPILDMESYEQILSIVGNMTLVLERSPKSFVGMGEEDLRTHFLVQLNGQMELEGRATGETFNYEGKTDILVRVNGRNIFIGECKFWTGPEGLRETIDQLLRYTSWRDTKTAILLFNRNRNLSAVLEKIPEVITEHPNYKSGLVRQDETRYRFTLRQRDDPNRDLIVTLLAFDIPTQ